MNDQLTIWAVQSAVPSTLQDENLGYLETLLADAFDLHQSNPDLIILPELFSHPFGVAPIPTLAEHSNGKTFKWLKMMAQRFSCTIAGGAYIKENNGTIFNRTLIVNKSGSVTHYDKRALFPLSSEAEEASRGTESTIIELKNFKLKFITCYDLRFPPLSTNSFTGIDDIEGEYHALICTAQWPAVRIDAWNALLAARAIENRSYAIGVNRVDFDTQADSRVEYSGNSNVYFPTGKSLFEFQKMPSVLVTTLDKSNLLDFRSKHPFLI